MMTATGATQKPEWQQEQMIDTDKCQPEPNGRVYKHKDVWVWENGVITSKVRCSTCGRVETKGE